MINVFQKVNIIFYDNNVFTENLYETIKKRFTFL